MSKVGWETVQELNNSMWKSGLYQETEEGEAVFRRQKKATWKTGDFFPSNKTKSQLGSDLFEPTPASYLLGKLLVIIKLHHLHQS